jgi:hypothetical protein
VGESGNAEGVFGSSATDSNFVSGVVGVEGGTNTETVGVYGYTSSGTGMGVYGQNVSGSSVLFLSPYAGVWGDSSAGEGRPSLGCNPGGDLSEAVPALSRSGNQNPF